MTNLSRSMITVKQSFQPQTQTRKIKMELDRLLTHTMTLSSVKRLSVIAMAVSMSVGILIPAAYATPLELRLDAREPGFAQVIYAYYQNKPYDALTTMLANRQLAFNASGTGNILLSDLYTRYGLPREADVALTRAGNSDVTASTRNEPWISYGKLLYKTGQDSLALNFLRDPPELLTPVQESERMIMVTNLLSRTEHPDDAIESLQSFQTPVHYYRKLARYNLAMTLLEKKHLDVGQSYSTQDLQIQKEHELLSVQILDDLMKDKMPPMQQIIKPSELAIRHQTQVEEKEKSFVLNANLERKSWTDRFRKDSKIHAPNLIENHVLGNASTFTESALSGPDVNDDNITPREVSNLNDKIALSLAYLRLLRDEPQLAKTALRNVQLDSPYSNQALLTSAHIYYRLKEYGRSFNFSNELIKRNPADPLVQEGWLLSASALEEQQDSHALGRYRAAIDVYKAESSQFAQFDREIDNVDVLKTFPVEASDPILLGLPKIPKTSYAGLWAQLLERSEILSILQQVQQTELLQSKLGAYEKQLAELEAAQTSPEDRTDIKAAHELLEKVKSDFQKSGQQDHKALLAQIRLSLKQKQLQLDHYLTESLLGLQRVSGKHSSAK
jgi:hypothetical protein